MATLVACMRDMPSSSKRWMNYGRKYENDHVIGIGATS
jgi:hypothetical protein